ncbi:hypothetical protein [Georgenia sp. MJ170]|uniref:hypothetical protein n=1 Tax=Georgenia sunbinii TaxID=3117728 RepID=UPI002F263581
MRGIGPRLRPAGADAEDGQITLLSLGFAVVALALILVVASATAIHLERKQLLALADGAAADAADAIDLERYYQDDLASAGVPLSDGSVRDAVAAHLDAALATSRFEGLRIGGSTGTSDGRTARVTLTAVARPPLVPWVLAPWSDGFRIQVTSLAEAEG